METFSVLIAIIGFLGGLLISVSQSFKKEYPKIYKILKSIIIALISSIVPTVVVLLYQIQITNLALNERLSNLEIHMDQNNSFSRASKKINSISSNSERASRAIFEKKLTEIDKSLEAMASNEILLEENEIVDVWSNLVSNAQKEIKALNLLSDWSKVSRDSFGIKLQLEALKSGVSIWRINLYDGKIEKHKEGLDKFMLMQKNKLGAYKNFSTELVDVNWIKGGRNERLYNELGTADFLIVDDSVLLLNFLNKENYGFQYSKITRDENTIKYAIELYNNILSDFKSN